MADDDSTKQSEEINEENDAREEDVVKDTDSDTKDVEQNDDRNADVIERRFSSIEATLDKILGQISSNREAQGVMVENGAVVQDVDNDDFLDSTDSFVSPAELDLLI